VADVFEPGLPWWELSPTEWHAFGYGLLDGLKLWKRKPVTPYEDLDKLPISPEWRADLKLKYHYYYVGFELPETGALIALLVYFGINNLPLVMSTGSKIILGV
jgi:hypothetical protein